MTTQSVCAHPCIDLTSLPQVFINREPDAFAHVLDFLRGGGGKLSAEVLADEAQLERIRTEFDYFLLPSSDGRITVAQAFGEGKYSMAEHCSLLAPRPSFVEQVCMSDSFTCIFHQLTDWTVTVEVWDLEQGRKYLHDFGRNRIRSDISVVHGHTLAVLTMSNTIALYDLRGGSPSPLCTLTAPSSAFDFDRILLSDGWVVAQRWQYLEAYVWSRESGELVRTISECEDVLALDGPFLLYRSADQVHLHDIRQPSPTRSFFAPEKAVGGHVWKEDEKFAVLWGATIRRDSEDDDVEYKATTGCSLYSFHEDSFPLTIFNIYLSSSKYSSIRDTVMFLEDSIVWQCGHNGLMRVLDRATLQVRGSVDLDALARLGDDHDKYYETIFGAHGRRLFVYRNAPKCLALVPMMLGLGTPLMRLLTVNV